MRGVAPTCVVPRGSRWHFIVALSLLVAICFVPAGGAQNQQAWRDWQTYPAIAQLDTPHDVYAIGDIHGDYERLLTVLTAAKIIPADPGPPEKVRWQAGKAVLVCTGDIIDKWNQSLQVIALFRCLQTEAAKAGGRVIVTLGNHEAEFLANPRNKKAVEFIAELEQKSIKPADVAAGKDQLGVGRWLRNLPVAARVNDWFFVHAGNTQNRTLAQLQTDLESGLDQKGFGAPVLQAEDSLLLARMHPQPWWEAKKDSAQQSKDKLAKCVHALGVQHLVIGHQPGQIKFAGGIVRKQGELIQHFDGLIFMIDTGISRGVGYSAGAILQIRQADAKTRAYRIPVSGKSEEIWSGPAR